MISKSHFFLLRMTLLITTEKVYAKVKCLSVNCFKPWGPGVVLFLPPASEGWGKVLFLVCQSTPRGGGGAMLRIEFLVSLCVSVHTLTGGVGGTWSQVQVGGVPGLGRGGPRSRWWWSGVGDPRSRSR